MTTQEKINHFKKYGASKKELIDLFQTSYKVFKRWIEEHTKAIGSYKGGRYTPKQILILFDKIGHP